jgi:hypothetical protein
MRSLRIVSFVLLAAIPASGEIGRHEPQNAGQRAPARPASGTLIAPDKLVALLPQVPGWTKGEPSSESVTTGIMMSVARVSYEKGDSNISLEIMDTAMNQMLIAPFTMILQSGYAETSGKGYRKGATIKGFPGIESWDPEGPSANVVVLVAERFLVNASGSGVSDANATRKVVEAVDLTALAGLK